MVMNGMPQKKNQRYEQHYPRHPLRRFSYKALASVSPAPPEAVPKFGWGDNPLPNLLEI